MPSCVRWRDMRSEATDRVMAAVATRQKKCIAYAIVTQFYYTGTTVIGT